MSKHTPGPWTYDPKHFCIVGAGPPKWDADNPDAQRAKIISTYGAMGGDDTRADALLMAAAPELLALLDEFLDQQFPGVVFDSDEGEYCVFCGRPHEVDCWVNRARTAVTKAHGQEASS